jgi:hypothetical protein
MGKYLDDAWRKVSAHVGERSGTASGVDLSVERVEEVLKEDEAEVLVGATKLFELRARRRNVSARLDLLDLVRLSRGRPVGCLALRPKGVCDERDDDQQNRNAHRGIVERE